MEQYILKHLESFNEYESTLHSTYLLVNKKSNLYYVKTPENEYVAWENVDSISANMIDNKLSLDIVKSYYNVVDGNLILKVSKGKNNNETSNRVIINLFNLLNANGYGPIYLGLDDVKDITNSNNRKMLRKFQKR